MEDGWLAGQFEEKRNHLRGVAQRILGTPAEAEDAVQETWLRLCRSDAETIENLGGWLTTVLSRICLDMLRARKVRPETLLEASASEDTPDEAPGPDDEVLLADSMGPALMLVLDNLAPSERVAFVLHDIFAVSFDEIASILGRTPEAARQLASRGRRRIQSRDSTATPARADTNEAINPSLDRARRQNVVDAFLAAARNGDFNALLAALHPDVVLRADTIAVQVAAANKRTGAPDLAPEIRGATSVAETFKGRAVGALRALIDGYPGAVWAQDGQVRSAFLFTLDGNQIAGIELVMDPARLGVLKVEIIP